MKPPRRKYTKKGREDPTFQYVRLFFLELVADAESEALPAETGGRNDVEYGTPVKRNLKREAGEDVLETNLGTYAEDEIVIATHPNLCGRTCIESERTYGSDLEVIGCADTESICAPTNADTECAGSRPPSCRWSG